MRNGAKLAGKMGATERRTDETEQLMLLSQKENDVSSMREDCLVNNKILSNLWRKRDLSMHYYYFI